MSIQQFFCIANDNENINQYEPANNGDESNDDGLQTLISNQCEKIDHILFGHYNDIDHELQQQKQIEQQKKKSDINTLPVYGLINIEIIENLKYIINIKDSRENFMDSQYFQNFMDKIFDLLQHNDDITIKKHCITIIYKAIISRESHHEKQMKYLITNLLETFCNLNVLSNHEMIDIKCEIIEFVWNYCFD